MLSSFSWMAYGVFNCKIIKKCLKPWRDLLRCWRCSSHWNISRSQILATISQSQSKSCSEKCGDAWMPPFILIFSQLCILFRNNTVAFQHYFLSSVTGQPGQGLASSKGRQGHQWPIHLRFNKSGTRARSFLKPGKLSHSTCNRFISNPLTACNLHRTHLSVQRVQLEVHRAG